MYDRELIEKVCNLTCKPEEINVDQTSFKYDVDHPFEKYYKVDIIIGAINKYILKEWNDITLANWCCIYDWILCGGFDANIKENFNPFERFLVDVISWDLDGLSFFDEDVDELDEVYEWIKFYKNIDRVWQTRNGWKGVYATIGEYDKENGQQYVVIVNDSLKEYMIIFSEHLKNSYKYQNEFLKYTTKNKFIRLIEKLKDLGYSNLSCSEECYYQELNDCDDHFN